jgi:hypothetical protein
VDVDFVCGAAQMIGIAMVNHSALANAAIALIRSVRILSHLIYAPTWVRKKY